MEHYHPHSIVIPDLTLNNIPARRGYCFFYETETDMFTAIWQVLINERFLAIILKIINEFFPFLIMRFLGGSWFGNKDIFQTFKKKSAKKRDRPDRQTYRAKRSVTRI